MHKLPALLLLSVLSAAAAPQFDFTLVSSSATAQAGSTAIFGYRLSNQSTAGELLGFSNLAFAAPFTGFGTETDLIDPLLVLPAGQSATGSLFQVTLLPSLAAGSRLDGTVFLTVQFDDVAGTTSTIPQRFSVTSAAAALPEPSAGILTAAGAALFALMRCRRFRR